MNNQPHESTDSNSFWGKGLAITIALFICTTLGVVAFMISLDFQMVTENHYQKAARYQQQINRIEQAGTLTHPVSVTLQKEKGELLIHFPQSIRSDDLRGTIELYRPSDASLDRTLVLNLDPAGNHRIDSRSLAAGKWQARVRWQSEGQRYFHEQTLFIP